MKNLKCLVLISLFFFLRISIHSQDLPVRYAPQEFHNDKEHPCLLNSELSKIIARVSYNRSSLKALGKYAYPSARSLAIPKFIWPLAQASGVEHHGFYNYGNFVDMNLEEDEILDYNGGSRTYDDHNGLDIGIWPNAWNRMENEEVQVIAAAPGIIMNKDDGFFDQWCTWDDTASWNFVCIEHVDGSLSIYGHLKKGTVTSLPIGSQVSTGDFLGYVGSSGRSTAPHLHFMVLDANENLVEPFKGLNNPISESYWADQPPYYFTGINQLNTYASPIVFNNCPNPNFLTNQKVFYRDDFISFRATLRALRPTHVVEIKAYFPEGGLFSSILDYSSVPNSFFEVANYPDDDIYISTLSPLGRWNYEVTISEFGTIVDNYTEHFWVVGTCPQNLTLSGIELDDNYRFANDWIQSSQIVVPSVDLEYDASKFIVLKPGFHAIQNSKFKANLKFTCPD